MPASTTAAGEPRRHGLRARWRDWVRRQVSRVLAEHWRIGVIDAPLQALLAPGPMPPVRWLTSREQRGYWADPFALPGDDAQLFAERFDERSGLGRIERLVLDGDRLRSIGPVVTVGADGASVRPGHGLHASFPHVFELDGERLAIAETAAARDCVLYRIDPAGRWHSPVTLLRGVAVADPAIVRHGGRLWLAATDVDAGEHDNLNLFHAERVDGPWLPHPDNPVRTGLDGSRMAGRFFAHGDALYRPGQDCRGSYGSAVILFRVDECSPLAYRETAVRTLAPDPDGPLPHGLHTVSAWGERTLVDGKRLVLNPVAVWRKLRSRLGEPGHAAAGQAAGLRVATPLPAGASRKVFVYLPNLRLGGGELSMVRLAEGFAAQGVPVTLVIQDDAGPNDFEMPPGVTRISLGAGRSLSAVTRLAALLRRERPGVLLTAFPHSNVLAVTARRLAGVDCCRLVLSEHAPVSQQSAQMGGWRYRLLPPFVRWAYPQADAVVAVSGGVREDLTRVVPGVVPAVIHNPVLPSDWAARAAAPVGHPWLEDASLEVVLSVSRLAAVKDLPALVDAFALVAAARPAARLVIAGDGPESDALRQQIARRGLADRAQLVGAVQNPLAWMRGARVFALTSRYEGFGNVLIEAMAVGTAVVSTDCPVGPREVLEDGRLGRLVPPGDVAAIAAAISAALDDEAGIATRRDAAAAAQGFTQQRACSAYLALFQTLGARGQDGSGVRC